MPAMTLRYFSLVTILSLLLTATFGYSYINDVLAERKKTLTTIAQGIQKRIDTYRFFTYQIYGKLNSTPAVDAQAASTTAINLMPNVFYVEKNGQKTDALIFGQHNKETLASAYRISRYLDVLWGAENNVYSMYYLNGIDNSLTMISTQTLKDIYSQFRGNYITVIAESRRTEMLQQANILDERESFSPLRKLRFYNDYYFTLLTTFNQPGHLATILAFDLPINDLIPNSLPRERLMLKPDTPAASSQDSNNTGEDVASVELRGDNIDISATLVNAPLKIVFQMPVRSLVIDSLRNNVWFLLLNLMLLSLSIAGFYLFRRKYAQPSETAAPQLEKELDIYRETTSKIPMGVLVYDFSSNKVVIQNERVERLLPHLSLQKIANMADEHQGVIQVTINNEMYEIRLIHSQHAPEYCLFLLREQDKEIQVQRQLLLAQREYEKNIHARKCLFQNLLSECTQPLNTLQQHIDTLHHCETETEQTAILHQLTADIHCAIELLENIALHEKLEAQEWHAVTESFSPRALMDAVLLELLPRLRQKGLALFHHYHLESNQTYRGDAELLKKTLALLLNYSVTNTDYGKITVSVDRKENQPDTLIIQISDTGTNISDKEQENIQHPFLHPTASDRFKRNSGLTLFLCNQLCNKLGGNLTINSKPGLGTHYILTLKLEPEARPVEEEKLLDGMTILLDITSEEVQHIVGNMLIGWGANYLVSDERQVNQKADIYITDDPQNKAEYTLLLSHDDDAITPVGPRRLRVNYNISHLLLEALLQLIELQLETSPDTLQERGRDDVEFYATQLASSDYYSLFVETVPDDLKRLYTEATAGDFPSLSQTAHRLKGVFAMLNLHPGKQQCEQLEQHIIARDSEQIEASLREIDRFVNALLSPREPKGQQGSQQDE
ncbi:phosphotransferase RcsD [Pectobacterium cacticida]|uniref:Phosphotransferase RcsD n=1 Tax=Pectobacterium cacticida TaxID=69221 RepID=A0ABZ2G913_9GAMM|nr:phosphotransferase RcsD [Pectobacterium cacticida]UYX07730.1 phosphotransferase RcsD [Pectobacterium cacticida]